MTNLISILSFLLPTQLSYHFHFLNINVMGFEIDYLIPAIYLTDIVIFLIILFGFKNIKINKKLIIISFCYLFFVIFNTLNSEILISSIYKWLKVTEMVLLVLIIKNLKNFDLFKHFTKPLAYSMIIINLLGIFQFINKGSLGGIFYYLGERSYSFLNPNVAPYPYSTFSHSNSYAGFLLVFVIFLLTYKKLFSQKFFYFSILLSLINLYLTNSLNIFLTITILLFVFLMNKSNFKSKNSHLSKNNLIKKNNVINKNSYINKNNFINKKGKRTSILLGYSMFTFLIFDQRYITHRLELIKASLTMIKNDFMFGVGLNNFIPRLAKESNLYMSSWELQPVHNIFLLIFSETGIVGISMFVYLVLSIFTISNYPLLAVIISGFSDHYWVTLQQNILMLVFVFIYSYKDYKNSLHFKN